MGRAGKAALAAALLALTAAKLLWPDTAEKAREKTLELLECRADYSELAETMGRSAAGNRSGGELKAALAEALGFGNTDAAVGAMERTEQK